MTEFVDVNDLIQRWGARAILEDYETSPVWVFEGLIEKGDQWIVSGAPKSGKSRLALQIAIAASEGTEFFGYKCTSRQKVLYIDFELSKRLSAERVVTMYANSKNKLVNNSYFFRCSDYKSIDILNEDDTRTLQAQIEALKPDLIIFDVLARMHGVDENSNPEMTKVMLRARQLSGDAAHIIVHHARKETYGNGGAKAIRGASSIHGEVNGVISLAVEGSKQGSHSVVFSLRGPKDPGKKWLDGKELMFNLVQADESIDKDEKLEAVFRSIFADDKAKSSGKLSAVLGNLLGITARNATPKMTKAVETGLLHKEQIGNRMMYSLAKISSSSI
ncbi:AAA family ATPase [Pseudomonas izuensis]|uniref:AAA family ATPase n=1 Tax=Pseudomonas izuensis TaxID=2684212 RepID=A0ABM7RPY6_9PSED|nr:AAA family ATPase [Pseudomonas izuensis]BCX67269.1 AAA family ATPase [Pseudomonas izuensis]